MDGNSMLIGGQWRPAIGTGRTEDVTSPYDGSVIGTVPVGSGLLLLPLLGGLLVTSIVGGQVITRTGRYKIFPIIGGVFMTAGMYLLSRIDVTSTPGEGSCFTMVLRTQPASNAETVDRGR